MGWGYCGEDSQGRSIGYSIPATCDHPDCNNKIDRGLAYACGGMHGESEHTCEKYFCPEHLFSADIDGVYVSVCAACLYLYNVSSPEPEEEDDES